MTQKALTVVIDEFSAAVAAVAEHAPPGSRERLRTATGDLLEALSTAAQAQAGGAALSVFSQVADFTAELRILRNRIQEDEASQAHFNMGVVTVAEASQAELGQHAAQIGILNAAVTTADHTLKEHIEQTEGES